VVLSLYYNPAPGDPLDFEAVEIPFTPSVDYLVDPNGRRVLSLKILLMDARSDMLMRVGEWDQDNEDKQGFPPSLVDFQAEQSIIDLSKEGKVTIRFRLPCCFLDSRGRAVLYRYGSPHRHFISMVLNGVTGSRICVSLNLDGKGVGFHILPGLFVVVHPGKKIPGMDLDYSNGSESYVHHTATRLITGLLQISKPLLESYSKNHFTITSPSVKQAQVAGSIVQIAILPLI
jgi:hypothetical protein